MCQVEFFPDSSDSDSDSKLTRVTTRALLEYEITWLILSSLQQTRLALDSVTWLDSTRTLAFGYIRGSSDTLGDSGFKSRADSTSLTRIDNMTVGLAEATHRPCLVWSKVWLEFMPGSSWRVVSTQHITKKEPMLVSMQQERGLHIFTVCFD